MEAIYKLRQRPGAEGFRAAWEAAIDRGVSRLESGALARAIQGEERMVVSAGKVLGTEVRHNEALVMFFLKNRLPARYGRSELVPGHPDYEALRERLRAEWDEEQRLERNSPENQEANYQFFMAIKERWRRDWEQERAWADRIPKPASDGEAGARGDAPDAPPAEAPPPQTPPSKSPLVEDELPEAHAFMREDRG
ncbi:hypothetical protein [Erythrobacter sp.]|jgi:hypothetical protein|uniref:hypothetical protein n=1 Tax=Erythrobacter sp. TaxID=1042 RepID=UPI002EB0C486|nr:hypothetical protein [Erythrobacter sp.]